MVKYRMAKLSNREQTAVDKIVDNLNKKRNLEFLTATDRNGEVADYLQQLKAQKHVRKGKHGAVLIAHIPTIVDEWFTKMYGPNYFKDKDFFNHFPEWKVADPKNL